MPAEEAVANTSRVLTLRLANIFTPWTPSSRVTGCSCCLVADWCSRRRRRTDHNLSSTGPKPPWLLWSCTETETRKAQGTAASFAVLCTVRLCKNLSSFCYNSALEFTALLPVLLLSAGTQKRAVNQFRPRVPLCQP